MDNPPLRLKIISKTGLVYEGVVESVSTVNEVGPLDILSDHEWFISPVTEKIAIVDDRKREKVWSIKNAILRVKENLVEVFIEE